MEHRNPLYPKHTSSVLKMSLSVSGALVTTVIAGELQVWLIRNAELNFFDFFANLMKLF